MSSFQLTLCSSLEKIMPGEEPAHSFCHKLIACRRETVSFQLLVKPDQEGFFSVAVDKIPGVDAEVFFVGLVPVSMAVSRGEFAGGGAFITEIPALVPDPLYKITGGETFLHGRICSSFWISLAVQDDARPGTHPLGISVAKEAHEPECLAKNAAESASLHATLFIMDKTLPDLELHYTNWLHVDSLMHHYRVEANEERLWQLCSAYIKNAVRHGMNTLLTPLFTLPLDTAPGKERKTFQLVKVIKKGGEYTFCFDPLIRWMAMAQANGIRNLEFSHLATQWGAEFTPKIIAETEDGQKAIFGWQLRSDSDEYRDFIRHFVPALVQCIENSNWPGECFFHISDEPRKDHEAVYGKLSQLVQSLVGKHRVIDALSDIEFYEKHITPCPIPATNHLKPFLRKNIANLWTYHCVAQQEEDYSNRFISMPASRTRILGVQLYYFGIKGFLHWGYNYWLSRLSQKAIDPFAPYAGEEVFPSGDAYLVYPGEEGPISSIREKVLMEAWQDMRLLQLLEESKGRRFVLSLLKEVFQGPIRFDKSTYSADRFNALWESVKTCLESHPQAPLPSPLGGPGGQSEQAASRCRFVQDSTQV